MITSTINDKGTGLSPTKQLYSVRSYERRKTIVIPIPNSGTLGKTHCLVLHCSTDYYNPGEVFNFNDDDLFPWYGELTIKSS
jgi:hypothetical protein